jgi:hypothetical protein
MNALRIKIASRLALLVQARYGFHQTYMLQKHHVILESTQTMIMRRHKQIRLMLTNLTCQGEPTVSHQFKLNLRHSEKNQEEKIETREYQFLTNLRCIPCQRI